MEEEFDFLAAYAAHAAKCTEEWCMWCECHTDEDRRALLATYESVLLQIGVL